jgi:serine-type D-Ala-D-Ala carboxypeptidase/endopeptidase (penicillin-binding protein 4)
MIDHTTRIDRRLNTTTSVELAAVESATLAEIVRRTNKLSLNLEAELLFRTIGRRLGQTAPDPDAVHMLMRGDDMAAAAVVKQWLAHKGIATENISIHDGSGLSRLDLVTTDAITRLLSAEAALPSAIQFRDSLPLAGIDGTLANRLTGPATVGRIQAKTGTLTGINSLSGYINAANGKTTAFSIICNDDTNGSSTQTIDAVATLLAKYQSLP